MVDPTSLVSSVLPSLIPERFKEKLADSLVELLAGSAERLGGDQIAGKIRRLSSRDDLLRSIDRALEAGIGRFIQEYMSQDEDLVEAIRADDLFWQSEMVQDALIKLVKRPGAWLREERETVAYHFETVLPKRLNRERVDKAINFLLRCIAEELWSLPGAQEIRAAYSIQFQELSVEAQREQVGLARQQLQATTQMSAGLQQALVQLVGLVEQKVLAAPMPVAMLASPRPYHNLPQPTYTQFIGREEELAWLRQRLLPTDRAWQIAITGIGGVGKSALALAVAWEYQRSYNELPPEERFEAIVWISAKEEVLTAFGRERANVPEQVLHTLEDVHTAIARVLEREDITRAQPEEQNALVEKALKRQRTLLIMDNLESVKDDRIKAFLRNLPSPTKAIVTSRESLDVAAVKPLTGLPWEKAEALIKEDCQLREVLLTSQQQRRVFELTSGLPLPIKLGIARMAGGESFALVDRWLGNAAGELPEYCVKGQIDLVRERDPNAWMVLLACALFDREAGASREAIGKVADLSSADRDNALAHLQRLFLVNCVVRGEDERFWVLPIVQRYIAAGTVKGAEYLSVTERWILWLGTFAHIYGLDPDDVERLQRIGPEYPNLLAAIRWCQQEAQHTSLLWLAEGTYEYVYLACLFSDFEEISRAASLSANTINDQRAMGVVALQMGRVFFLRNSDLAIPYFENAERIAEQVADYRSVGRAWGYHSHMLCRQGRLAEAEAMAQQLVALGRRIKSTSIVSSGLTNLALVATERGEFDKALALLAESVPLAQARSSKRMLSRVLFFRAQALLRKKDYMNAESTYLQAMSLSSSWGERQYVANDKMGLALICAETGRAAMARTYAGEARDIYDVLGLFQQRDEADELLTLLTKPNAEAKA